MNQQQINTSTATASAATKSVTFSTTAKMRLALHINEYTDEEIEACYYSREESRAFKLDVKRTVRMIETKRNIDEDKICTRGTESHVKETATMRSKIRRAARSTVLKEQWRQQCRFDRQQEESPKDQQQQKFELDCERIAAKYAPISGASAVAAYVMGLSDAELAKELTPTGGQEEAKENDKSSSSIAFKLLKLRNVKAERNASPRREVFNSAA